MVYLQDVFDIKANKLLKALGMRHEKKRRDLGVATQQRSYLQIGAKSMTA